jgi:outer membrane lipoprotein-sorting protein
MLLPQRRKKLKRWLKIILSGLFLSLAAGAFAADMKFNFVKTTIEDGEKETIGGFIYIKDAPVSAERSVYFCVTYPVNQIMTFTKKETYVYYPGEKKAIVISSPDGISNFNFIETASHPVDPAALGFRMKSSKKEGGAVSEIWVPASAGRTDMTSLMVENDPSGRLLLLEARNKDGIILSRASYSGYKEIGSVEMPMEIASYSAQGASGIEETYTLSDAVVNAALPGIIKDFKLPEGTNIQKVEMK